MKTIFEVVSIREEIYKNVDNLCISSDKEECLKDLLFYTDRYISNWFVNYIVLNTLLYNRDSILERLKNRQKQYWNNLYRELKTEIKDYIDSIKTDEVKIKGTLDKNLYLHLVLRFGKKDYLSTYSNNIFRLLTILETDDLEKYLSDRIYDFKKIVEDCEDKMNYLPTFTQLKKILSRKEKYIEDRKLLDKEFEELSQIPWLRLH